MSITKILEAIKLAVSLVPVVEAVIPLPKKGQQKLDLILGIITDSLGAVDTILPLLKAIIARTVTTANTTGVFPVTAHIDENAVMN